MSKINMINNFVIAVNKNIPLDSKINESIKETYEKFKQILKDSEYSIKKLGDFKYKSFYSKSKVINLDLAIVKYFPIAGFKHQKFSEDILELFKQMPIKYKIKKYPNYISVYWSEKGIEYNFRFILMVRKLEQGFEIDYVNRNGIVQDDWALQVTEAFCTANKISGGTLFKVKRVLNYILKDEFSYTYNLDYSLLSWFYEYFSRSLNSFIDQKYNIEKKELQVENFSKIKNLKLWFSKHVNINNLYFFIFSKLQSINTYYYSEISFENYEIFADISRYSLNTNSNFALPSSFFKDIRIFDLQNFDDLTFIQTNCGNEFGYSKIAWDKARNEDKRYFVSPCIVTGISNFAMFRKWFTKLSEELYSKLSTGLKEEIKSTKQREAMEELNMLAHNWLSSYISKTRYLKPYFDAKYPFAGNSDFETILKMITTTLDKIDEQSWIMENDN
ncbi:hypothetical protein SCHIN_v1c05350 [Spiroplasma chinense]|uniref:Uncharacterized protein n=1 Tax=Spiroplasma chinense TaxID=216932 RepID=A0A5B9Y6M0_9MOLU|nr:hypothetical protein [Spiroplasma chinense]QEH61732.1 hypothetical protein SCHIN_v1c05350 [Spiroplasma chinense]